jgi:GntR family transcriptional regulator
MRRTGRIYGPGEYAKIVSAALVSAPENVAAALGVTADSQVIERTRVTYKDDAAVSASRSWFNGELAEAAPKLLATDRLPEGTPGYIQATAGLAPASGRDQVSARGASAEDAALLGIAEGAPVRVGRNWLYDAEGAVIEYGESVSLAGRWASYDYDIPN